MGTLTWKSIASYLATVPVGQALRVANHRVEHPLDAGFKLTVSLPVGQRGDYRAPVQGGHVLHVYDFDRYYVAILENSKKLVPASKTRGLSLGGRTTALGCAKSAKLPRTPHGTSAEGDASLIAVGAALGSALGLLLGRSTGGAVAGAALGALLGGASSLENNQQGLSDAGSRPATASRVVKAVRKSNSTPSGPARGRRKEQP